MVKRYTSWNIKAPARKQPCSAQTRMEQGQSFKAMYASLGFTVADVAKFLQVTPRTVQLWISGRVRVPYMATKLLRLQLRYELPGEAWNGWHISAGRLYTPEGHELNPLEFTWWSLLVRQARMFRVLYRENNQLRQDVVAGRTASGTAATSRSGARPEPAKSGPTDAVGRPAQPADPNLLPSHIPTRDDVRARFRRRSHA